MNIHLSKEDERRMAEILAPYRKNKHVQLLKKYIHHGDVTTYEHCDHVARVCYRINRKLHLHTDERALIVAAFLHDFYLYDWHEKNAGHRLHGFSHPTAACNNAVKNFQIGLKEQNIIRTHMWPLTLYRLPSSKEAWIVSLADKYCSIVEVVESRLGRNHEKCG